MIIGGLEYHHIQVLDETGGLVATISDEEVILKLNCDVKLCRINADEEKEVND